LNQSVLAIDDGGQIRLGGDRIQSEFTRTLHQRHDLSRAQNRFGRHAPPQNAQSPERTLIHDGHIGARIASRPSSSIPGRSAPDDHDIVSPFRHVREL